jgi:hypothetical protein
VPTSVGNYSQWATFGSSTHFANVDETPCNGATDCNSTTVTGNRDSYGVSLTSVPNGSTITQIDIKPCASHDQSGTGSVQLDVFYRKDGVNSADSGGYTFGNSQTPTEQATTSFSGLSIVKSATTTLEVGAVLTSGTKGLRVSRIVKVFWDEAPSCHRDSGRGVGGDDGEHLRHHRVIRRVELLLARRKLRVEVVLDGGLVDGDAVAPAHTAA